MQNGRVVPRTGHLRNAELTGGTEEIQAAIRKQVQNNSFPSANNTNNNDELQTPPQSSRELPLLPHQPPLQVTTNYVRYF